MKKALAWLMVLTSAAGMIATQFGVIAEGEPRVVLQLSWAALLFSGFDGLLITKDD